MNPSLAIESERARAQGEPVAAAPRSGLAGFADLHLHTLFSDGTFTPEELAERGRRLGLVAMALTDHDTVEGCGRMGRACASLDIEFIPGTELTAEYDGHEVHLLGYFLEVEHPRLLGEIKKFQTVRQNRIREMASRLNKLGVPLRAESVFELANCHSPGRPHVGRALVLEGLCSSVDEAFEKYLKKGRPAWVPKYKISALEAMDLIHQAGGLAVLAHPALNHSDHIIPNLVGQGLDGMECFHTRHTADMTEHYLKMAGRLNLAVTGGSDCHGYSKGKPLIGGVKLAAVYLEKLKQARLNRACRPRPAAANSA
ncbi:MAG: PHP domain-containing protein [Verrucomicrobiota bacterium]|jgi:predicted metal-dependent phosphoesterase TrpH